MINNKNNHPESYDQQIIGKMFYYRKVGNEIIRFRIARTEITNNNQIKIFNDTGNQSFLISQNKIESLLAVDYFEYYDCCNITEGTIGIDERDGELIGKELIKESHDENNKEVLGKIANIIIGTFVVFVKLENSKEVCISLHDLCALVNDICVCHSTSEEDITYYINNHDYDN